MHEYSHGENCAEFADCAFPGRPCYRVRARAAGALKHAVPAKIVCPPPKVGGRKYHQHLASVLGQALIVHLAVAELALNDQKMVLGLGANADQIARGRTSVFCS